jgi:ParB-like chromosome segregation protein Spo0J
MTAVAANTYTDNVIPVDFRTAEPVVVDFRTARTPQGEIARRLVAEAATQSAKLGIMTNSKAGTLRTLAATDDATGRNEYFDLNPYLVEMEDDWNCRDFADPENIDHIDNLARSIVKIGIQDPLTVRLDGKRVVLTDGHCRWFAVIRAIEVYGAEIKTIPLIAESRYATAAQHIARQLLVGKPKSPIEQGRAFVRLINYGWSIPQIVESVGIGRARVKQILDFIADSSEVIQKMVIQGKVAQTEAEKVLRASGGDTALAERTLNAAVVEAVAAGKTRATGKHVKEAVNEAKATSKAELRLIIAKKLDTNGKGVNFTVAEWKKMLAI